MKSRLLKKWRIWKIEIETLKTSNEKLCKKVEEFEKGGDTNYAQTKKYKELLTCLQEECKKNKKDITKIKNEKEKEQNNFY